MPPASVTTCLPPKLTVAPSSASPFSPTTSPANVHGCTGGTKLMASSMTEGAGTPSTVAGESVHFARASSAASSNALPGELTTSVFATPPSGERVIRNATAPCTPLARSEAGYSGSPSHFADGGTMTGPASGASNPASGSMENG